MLANLASTTGALPEFRILGRCTPRRRDCGDTPTLILMARGSRCLNYAKTSAP